MIGVQRKEIYGSILALLLISRVVAETVNTFAWDKADSIWSSCALVCIGVLLWPLLAMMARREKNIFGDYWPIFLYLSFMLIRVDFGQLYSVRCFLSEVIVWFSFIFTVEACSRNGNTGERVQRLVVWICKFVVVVGMGQLVFSVVHLGNIDPTKVIESRPVQGIFVHPSIYLIMVLPFSFFFMKQRSYFWLFVVLFVCVSTGTRSPFLAVVCMSILVYKSALKRQINLIDIGITLAIIIVLYAVLIKMNSHGWSFENADSRWTFATLRWRVNFWKSFLKSKEGIPIFLGHGVGSADFVASDWAGTIGYPPHNDYLRIYYDTGILGIICFINLAVFILRSLIRSCTIDNDFAILMYLMIMCFSITDNFIYVTNSILLYIFISSYISRPSMSAVEVRA